MGSADECCETHRTTEPQQSGTCSVPDGNSHHRWAELNGSRKDTWRQRIDHGQAYHQQIVTKSQNWTEILIRHALHE